MHMHERLNGTGVQPVSQETLHELQQRKMFLFRGTGVRQGHQYLQEPGEGQEQRSSAVDLTNPMKNTLFNICCPRFFPILLVRASNLAPKYMSLKFCRYSGFVTSIANGLVRAKTSALMKFDIISFKQLFN